MPAGGSESFDFRAGQRWRLSGSGKHRRASGQPVRPRRRDDKGQAVNWSFELPSPVTLMRRGWTRESLKPGERITVTGAPARNYPTIAIANGIKDAAGKPLFTGTTQIYEPEAPSKPTP
jgi:hypothetical protein